MAEQLYSAEEAAQILGLQVRTVRNYVRDGRLPGVRIGKQYRIARADLEAFTGGGAAGGAVAQAPEDGPVVRQPPRGPSVEASAVVQVDDLEADAAERIMRTLTAATAIRADTDPPLRVEPFYDDERVRLRVVLVGGVAETIELMRMIDALARDGR
jgi:excisionase family DNA binding protein